MEEKAYTSIVKAKPLFFQRKPSTQQATEACLIIAADLLNLETRKRARKKSDQASFDKAVGHIIGDLLNAAASDHTDWVYRSLNKESFIGGPVGAVTFKAIIYLMMEDGLVVQHKGGNLSHPFTDKTDKAPKYSPGMASRFKATPKLLSLLKAQGLTPDNVSKHFQLELPRQTIKLKASSQRVGRQKQRGRLLRPKYDNAVLELEQQVNDINVYLSKQQLEGGIFNGFQRVFNEGDRSDFRWNMGGRLYAVGDESYQLMKKTERLQMKINGAKVAEVDINASYLCILASRLAYPIPEDTDLYAVTELPREVVKAWITATLGNDGFHNRWPVEANRRLKELGYDTSNGMSCRQVQDIVCAAFPFLHQWESGGIRWSHLMHQESEQIIYAMETLRDEYDVPSYPVHDSLIVPSNKVDVAVTAIEDAFMMYSNQNCRLSISRAS